MNGRLQLAGLQSILIRSSIFSLTQYQYMLVCSFADLTQQQVWTLLSLLVIDNNIHTYTRQQYKTLTLSSFNLVWLWTTLAITNSMNSHSGYHFPFFPSPEAHDFHHLKFNQCYGVLGILDYLHGTDIQFRESKVTI